MSVRAHVGVAIATILAAASASASDLDGMFRVSGYGTFGLTHSDEDQADFVNSPVLQPKGAGYSDEWSTDVESRLGLQVNARFSDRFSGVVQLVSEAVNNVTWNGDVNENYVPSLEWANVSYRVTNDFTVRAGRVVLPIMAMSEIRKVGFAQHWVRPPVDVYANVPFTSSDGLDLSYRFDVAGGANTLRAHVGTQSLRSKQMGQTDTWGVNSTFEKDAWTVRAAYMLADARAINSPFDSMFGGFAAAARQVPGGDASADRALQLLEQFDPANKGKIHVYDLAFTYDPGNWFVLGEFMHEDSRWIVNPLTSGLISGGVRLNNFKPYVTYSRIKTNTRAISENSIPLAGLPPDMAGFGSVLNGIVAGFVRTDNSQQTLAAGVRWDFTRNFALKAQYDHIDMDDGSIGLLGNQQPGFKPGGSLNVFSLTLDYVF